jgi:UDP-N-acetylmuramyl pentapeptide phosphotransferase/UDP-N-acetylglucosamine-1-phosphate transferase
MPVSDPHRVALALVTAVVAALVCVALILALRPLLQRYALARPNARSSHVVPTPQGGGIAVMIATAIAPALVLLPGPSFSGSPAPAVLLAAFWLAAVGMVDDLRPIPVIPRLALQTAAVLLLLAALPVEIRIFEAVPLVIERAILVVGLLWFVNLVNFMDGLDWMTVAEMLPLTATLALLVFLDAAPVAILPIALPLAGALIGFAPFNRPVARLFLGDVGSLPIGLLTGWCLLALAERHFVAALLLPLYYLADATITLLRRLIRGERFWDAHRSHFYQRATDNGFTVKQVVKTVFVLNLLLAALAIVSATTRSPIVESLTLIAGGCAVAAILVRFSRPRRAA